MTQSSLLGVSRQMQSFVDVVLMQEAINRGKHLTMDGSFVDCHSADCLDDLERRIADAVYVRDLASTRSDERTYYNGVLSVLRRQLRSVRKELQKNEAVKHPLRETRSRSTQSSSRMLRLAGIF